jgi:hypothetical protein
METDYTAAIFTVIALVVVFGGMSVYVLSRPTDLTPRSR